MPFSDKLNGFAIEFYEIEWFDFGFGLICLYFNLLTMLINFWALRTLERTHSTECIWMNANNWLNEMLWCFCDIYPGEERSCVVRFGSVRANWNDDDDDDDSGLYLGEIGLCIYRNDRLHVRVGKCIAPIMNAQLTFVCDWKRWQENRSGAPVCRRKTFE